MTADERHTVRAARDRATRERVAAVSEWEARHRRLYAACSTGSTVDRAGHVRHIERTLDRLSRNTKGAA